MTTRILGCSLRIFRSAGTILLLALGATVPGFSAQAQQLAATYRHGSLSLTIPYDSAQEGSGKLTVEILDPEDKPVGHAERAVNVRKGNGSWRQTVSPEQPIPFEEIVWHRIRYRFEFDEAKFPAIAGIESI